MVDWQVDAPLDRTVLLRWEGRPNGPQPPLIRSATQRAASAAILVAAVAAAVPHPGRRLAARRWRWCSARSGCSNCRGRHRCVSAAGRVRHPGALATNTQVGSSLLVVVAALAADLDRFAARLDEAGRANEASLAERRSLEAQHLRRLLRVSLLGLALAWLALAVRVQLAFGLAVALGLVAALALAALVRALIRQSD